MDSQKKLDYNKKLKDRYNYDEDYREKRHQESRFYNKNMRIQ